MKTAAPTQVVSGGEVTYTLVAGNAGPGAAHGSTLRDPPVAGIDCTGATPQCVAGGGAECPASPTVAQLQSAAGVDIPVLPAGGTATFILTCTVTASGQP